MCNTSQQRVVYLIDTRKPIQILYQKYEIGYPNFLSDF